MNAEQLIGMNGRRALIEGVIESLALPEYVFVQFDPVDPDEHTVCQVPVTAIREILPEPVKVGDRVRAEAHRPCNGPDGLVIAVAEGAALLRYPNGEVDGFPLSDLTLMEPGQ